MGVSVFFYQELTIRQLTIPYLDPIVDKPSTHQCHYCCP